MGDNSIPFVFKMELWDTVTNSVVKVPHPVGFENSRFFRPVMTTFNDDSVILLGSNVFEGSAESHQSTLLSEMFQYKFGTGWINLGSIDPQLESKRQYGIYFLKNPGLATFISLNQCASLK